MKKGPGGGPRPVRRVSFRPQTENIIVGRKSTILFLEAVLDAVQEACPATEKKRHNAEPLLNASAGLACELGPGKHIGTPRVAGDPQPQGEGGAEQIPHALTRLPTVSFWGPRLREGARGRVTTVTAESFSM